MAEPQDEQSPSLDDCLKLLKVVAMEVRIMVCICGCLLQFLLLLRVPEITSSVEMVSQIPLILEIMSKERYKLLYLVSTACEVGVMALINSGGLRVIAPQMSDLPDGSHAMEVAIKILQLLVSKLSSESMNIERFFELSLVVAAVARQFAVLHNALKFEALHLLSAVFCSDYSLSS
ncbi:hypothetical protein Bca52824_079408 [Brassica carinata]|uniref:Uncharacterized protein n=1 Tax=Brassica carinata TaxID=52824 RepID=A0A8X7U033_BRACI|nr:hypothetical protein Bca52824_079408 [Brassica carinata]